MAITICVLALLACCLAAVRAETDAQVVSEGRDVVFSTGNEGGGTMYLDGTDIKHKLMGLPDFKLEYLAIVQETSDLVAENQQLTRDSQEKDVWMSSLYTAM
jgi:hypothetical protein